MSTAAEAVIAALNDVSLWVVQPGVNVFDEHSETRDDGTAEVFDRPRLERIAGNCNARDAAGQPCPLTLGHTRDGAAETEQPEGVGYARQFHVAYDARLGRWVIRCSYHLRKDRAAEARQYPRTSVERWPGADFFDPIALLKVTPRLDLGQWTYGRAVEGPADFVLETRRDGRVRYSMAEPSMAPAPPAGGPPSGDDEYARMKVHMQRYMQECMPHLMSMAPPPAAPPAAPAMPPAAPAPPAPPAMPPAAHPPAAPPAPPHDPTQPPRPPAPAERNQRMEQDSQAIRYQQLEAQIAAERYARRSAEAEAACIQLEAERFVIDRAKEVPRMAALTEAQQAERVKEIRENYRRAPVGGAFVPTAKVQGPGGKPALDREGMTAALRYQREKKCTWDEAVNHQLGTG